MSNSLTASHKKEKIMAILKELDTKGKVGNSLYEGLKTTAIGLAGAGIGKAAGRPSLIVGIATAMAGHYFDSKRLTYFGVGILAGGGIATADSLKGPDQPFTEKVKDRFKSFGSDLKHRFYIDKFVKAKTKSESGTNGLGEVQYFKYPGNELNMGSLDNIEEEIRRSSELMERRQMAGHDGKSGTYDDMAGVEDKIY